MALVCVGIDPGISGGIAAVEGDPGGRPCLLDVWDIPVVGDGAGARVDVVQAIALIRQYSPGTSVIERAQAMPDQGASSGFKYGRAVGALEACLQGLLIPMTIIESSAWKKAHGLIKTDKEASRQRALQLFPEAGNRLGLKKHHNRAESVLIARYGLLLAFNNGVVKAA